MAIAIPRTVLRCPSGHPTSWAFGKWECPLPISTVKSRKIKINRLRVAVGGPRPSGTRAKRNSYVASRPRCKEASPAADRRPRSKKQKVDMGPPRFHCATSMKVCFIEARFRSSDLWVPHVGDPVGLHTGKSVVLNDGILEIYTHAIPVFKATGFSTLLERVCDRMGRDSAR